MRIDGSGILWGVIELLCDPFADAELGPGISKKLCGLELGTQTDGAVRASIHGA